MNLPFELFVDIAHQLAGSQAEQAKLARTSKALNDIVTPLLYHSVTLTSHQAFVEFARLAGAPEHITVRGTIQDDVAEQLARTSGRPHPPILTPNRNLLFVRDLAIWCGPSPYDERNKQHRCVRLYAITLACPNLITLLLHPCEPNLNFLREVEVQRSGDKAKELHYICVHTDEPQQILAGWNNQTFLPSITRMFLEIEHHLLSLLFRELGGRHPGSYAAYDSTANRWYSAPILRHRFPNLTHLVLTCRNESERYTHTQVAVVVRVFLKSLPKLQRLLLVVRHPVSVDNHNKDCDPVRRSDFRRPRLQDTRVWLEILATGDPRVYGVLEATDPRLAARVAVDEWNGAHGWESMLWKGFVLKQAYSWESGVRMCPE